MQQTNQDNQPPSDGQSSKGHFRVEPDTAQHDPISASVHKSKRAVVIILLTAVIFALALGCLWAWRNTGRSDKNPPSNTGVIQRGSEDERPIPPGFTLYQNTHFGFSFAYPEKVGSLTDLDKGLNSILLYVASKDTRNDFAPHTMSPLYVRADSADGFLTRAGKYGPILEFSSGKWIVSDKEGGDILNDGYELGAEFDSKIVRTINGTPVYDFSFTDEGCYRAIWVFGLENAFITITNPAVCADEIGIIPQDRIIGYAKVTEQILATLELY